MPRKPVKKDAIDNAAIHLFAKEGLVASTIKKIAKAADVTEGALYRHYSGKDDMAWQLYQREVQVFIEGMSDLISGEDIPLERRVAGIVSYIFNYYKHHPDKLVFVLFTRNSFPDKYMERDEYNPDLIFVQMLSEEMAKATIPQADTALLLAMVRGLILEPIMMHRYGFLKTHPDKHADLVIDKVWLVLKGSR